MLALIVHVFLLIITFLLGYLFYTGKAGFLPSGIFRKESQVDAKRLMRFTGSIMFCIAFCICLMVISDIAKIEILHIVALILTAIVVIIFLICGNGKHFLK